MNCCCRRPEDIKEELPAKTQQFIYPYIKPILLCDESEEAHSEVGNDDACGKTDSPESCVTEY
ncbi:hypothetical protein BWI95_01950 [Kosakonia cowanii JCM 10956 = DSM 18146]|uniref:Uncharacterized protein n=1 Tax=Kosakonia cowanii JCM 10956 = DSM 18146 TaxID=1300165 RepID=A0A807LCJ5_9ENTR|nr:hypothetical protein BWI95_01950 [Kosakonia cowanii JCM 10956 = DSM 18146]